MCEKAWSRSWSKHSEPVSAGPEREHSALVADAEWRSSSEGKPSDERTNYFLSQLREELAEIRKTFESSDNAVSLALASVCNLERHIAALEKESRETVRSPETNKSVVQQIAALRESLEGKCPQEIKESPSKEGETYVLVAPIKGVSEDGRLIFGDQKIMSARALKI